MRKDNEARKSMKMPSSRVNWFIFIASTSVLFDKTFVNSLVVSSGSPSGKKILKHLKEMTLSEMHKYFKEVAFVDILIFNCFNKY